MSFCFNKREYIRYKNYYNLYSYMCVYVFRKQKFTRYLVLLENFFITVFILIFLNA